MPPIMWLAAVGSHKFYRDRFGLCGEALLDRRTYLSSASASPKPASEIGMPMPASSV